MSHRTLFYYDQESNVTCVRDDDMGLTYYTYDLLNRMTSLKNPFDEVTYYEYTPGGQVSKRTLGNDTLTYYEHDDVGRVSKVDNRKSNLSVISTFAYEHDKVGNPTKITREDGSATYYQYDKIYQLTGETQVDDQGQVEYAFEYHYDKAHNRTVKVDNGTATYYAYNEANELTDETTNGQTTYYSYDRCGNTVAKQEPAGTTYYAYDTENLMTRIDFPDGQHNYFRYDADSKRVSKQDSDGFTEFIYQGPDMLKLLLERDDQGVTQAHYTMGDGLEAMRRNSTSSFYHYNHLGTTHELTDASQNMTDTYRHDAWGVLLARTGSTVNPHTYVGRERYYWIPEPRTYLLGVRCYDPCTGHFLTVDPGREGTNWCVYASNLPSARADPSGSFGVIIDESCYQGGYVDQWIVANYGTIDQWLSKARNAVSNCPSSPWTRGCLQYVLWRNVSIRCGGPYCAAHPDYCGYADIVGGTNVIVICKVGKPVLTDGARPPGAPPIYGPGCPTPPALLIHEATHLCYAWARGGPGHWDYGRSEPIADQCEYVCYPSGATTGDLVTGTRCDVHPCPPRGGALPRPPIGGPWQPRVV